METILNLLHIGQPGEWARLLRIGFNTLVILISGTLILSEVGISIAPILGAAGVIGIAVGFGAQPP